MTAGANHWAVVPAAGIGRRMGGEIPKQYLPLLERPVIEHGLEILLNHARVEQVVVALSPADQFWPTTRYADHPKVLTVPGGAERGDSVLNALRALEGVAHEDDWVLVHDAARPCLRREDLDLLMERLACHPVGGLLAVPLHDTVKRSGPTGEVIETLPREQLWRAYTPQMFRYALLRDLLSRALSAGVPVTDESSAVEWAGLRPLLVEGHGDNIKITRPEDLALAAFHLQQRG